MIAPAPALTATVARLLAGPPEREDLAAHMLRLGPRPAGGPTLLDELDAAGLRGRGGAWFPTHLKWRSVAERSRGRAVVVVNASEGEPLSSKDRTLLTLRPHLVLDGAELAAETIGAGQIVVYVGAPFRAATGSLRQALRERRMGTPVHVERSPHTYVAGESSAAVRRINGGPAKPSFTPPHVADRGVLGRPTLVQNAETLCHVALIARRGAAWFRELGTMATPGSALLTLSGCVSRPGVYEVDLAGDVGSVLDDAGGTPDGVTAVLLGGYFGSWVPGASVDGMALDGDSLRARGASLGCGVIAVLPEWGCGVAEAARILTWLDAQGARQCGPCLNGLRAIATTMRRLAASRCEPDDVERLLAWGRSIEGRGACRHPDGAVHHLRSALRTFAGHMESHLAGVPCAAAGRHALPGPPQRRWFTHT